MTTSLEDIINSVGELVSLPEVCIKINAMIDDPDVGTAEIGKVISQDPALTVRLLRIANSPFYGLSNKVDNVSRAVALIGMKQIRDMVMATAATRAFNGLPNSLVTMDNFWSHSTYCGLAARILADHCSKGQGESLFIAGLLHDIGQLIIFNKLPELAQKALMASIEDPGEPELWAVERDIIGFDHCQAGVALARKWQLPELLQECIEFHHQPEGAKTFPVPVAIIHIANSLAYLAETNSTELDDAPKIHPSALETTGISSDVFLTTVEAAREQYGEVKSAIFAD